MLIPPIPSLDNTFIPAYSWFSVLFLSLWILWSSSKEYWNLFWQEVGLLSGQFHASELVFQFWWEESNATFLLELHCWGRILKGCCYYLKYSVRSLHSRWSEFKSCTTPYEFWEFYCSVFLVGPHGLSSHTRMVLYAATHSGGPVSRFCGDKRIKILSTQISPVIQSSLLCTSVMLTTNSLRKKKKNHSFFSMI